LISFTDKDNEDRLCDTNSHMGEQANVLNCTNGPSDVVHPSLDTPLSDAPLQVSQI